MGVICIYNENWVALTSQIRKTLSGYFVLIDIKLFVQRKQLCSNIYWSLPMQTNIHYDIMTHMMGTVKVVWFGYEVYNHKVSESFSQLLSVSQTVKI